MFLTRCTPRNEVDPRYPRGRSFPHLFREFLETEGRDSETVTSHRQPLTNVSETDSGFVFSLEMPGIAKENVGVSVEGDRLIITGGGEEKTEEKVEDKGLIRREFHATRFERSFRLGNEVDTDSVKAKMLDGVLTVAVSKKQEKVGRKVDVA